MAELRELHLKMDKIREWTETNNLDFKKCNLEASKLIREIKSLNGRLTEEQLRDILNNLDKYQEAVEDKINEGKKAKEEIKDLKIKLLQENLQVQIRERTGRKQLTDSGIGSAGFVGPVGIPERLSVPVQTTDEVQETRISLSGPSGLSLTSLNINGDDGEEFNC